MSEYNTDKLRGAFEEIDQQTVSIAFQESFKKVTENLINELRPESPVLADEIARGFSRGGFKEAVDQLDFDQLKKFLKFPNVSQGQSFLNKKHGMSAPNIE